MTDDLKEKIARELLAHAVFSERGAERNRELALGAAESVLLEIEAAGYIVVPRPVCSQGECDDPEWCNCPPIGCRYGPWRKRITSSVASSEPSYADLSDSATTFNPEEQFEKDNGL
jgi:hypothetical protein